ncbi:MAG TPA: hypothetical protein VF221_11075 [Chloroflexota bacterium]
MTVIERTALVVLNTVFARSVPSEEKDLPLCPGVEHALRDDRRERGTGILSGAG